jgi:hypothetical protein
VQLAVPVDEPDEYCLSCRLNHTIPDLGVPGAKEAWHRLEIAKRRLLYTLLDLDLPVDGLAFSFLKDDPAAAVKVFTGHSDGVITINVAEADTPFRERRREQLGETYRTLLGHFRHEIGPLLLAAADRRRPAASPVSASGSGTSAPTTSPRRSATTTTDRRRTGSERFVSAYASMHPWEDWAETWAHYLHMVDTLETARSFGLALKPRPASDAPSQPPVAVPRLQSPLVRRPGERLVSADHRA